MNYYDPAALHCQRCSVGDRLHQPDFRTCHDRTGHTSSDNSDPQTSGIVMITRTPYTIKTTGTLITLMTTETPITLMTDTPTTSGEGPTTSPTDDKGEKVRIKAKNFAFDVSRITVPAQVRVIVEFENEDDTPHNVAFYTTPSLTTSIYKGEIITGPRKITYVFTTPAIPGTYFFHCDLHPAMQGQFIVT
jgi:plastocyanin